MNSFDTSTILIDGKSYSSIQFPDENCVYGNKGDAVLPGRTIFVGIPLNAQPSVQIMTQSEDAIELNHPVLKHRIYKSGDNSEKHFSAGELYETKIFYYNNYRLLEIDLNPCLYQNETSFKINKDIKINITFNGSEIGLGTSDLADSLVMKKLMINYDIAKYWKRMPALKKGKSNQTAINNIQEKYSFRIGNLCKLPDVVSENQGVVKITGTRIKSLFGNIAFNQIAVLGSPKGLLPLNIDDSTEIPDGITAIPTLQIDKNQNGLVDTEDCIIFYVTGSSDYVYNSTQSMYVFKYDLYDDYRTYWLCRSSIYSKKIVKFNSQFSANDTLFCTDYEMCFKKQVQPIYECEYSPTEGDADKVWKMMDKTNTLFNYNLNMPCVNLSDTGIISFLFTKSKTKNAALELNISNNQFTDIDNNQYIIPKWINTNFQLKYSGQDSSFVELYSFNVKYKKKIEIDSLSGQCRIWSSDVRNDPVNYCLKKIKNEKYFLFRLPVNEENIALIDTIDGSHLDHYCWADTAGQGTMYFACSERAQIVDPEMKKIAESNSNQFLIRNLKSLTNKSDYLIITDSLFIAASNRLAEHKHSIGFESPVIVMVGDIYNQFSGGNKDPVAIRNFLLYAKRYWTNKEKLRYVVLVGNGNRNPKILDKSKPDIIPVFYYGDHLCDDFYTYSDLKVTLPTLSIARIPCVTNEEANAYIDKIIEMEIPAQADFGCWRNKILFVADDDKQVGTPDAIGSGHVSYSDQLDTGIVFRNRPFVNRYKNYLFEYKTTNGMKPEATQNLIRMINSGVGYINFFGHGGSSVWTDEHVLTNESVLMLHNQKKYPFITAFSCNVGQFDHEEDCLAGKLVMSKKCGAAVCLASTRESDASTNFSRSTGIYNYLLDTSQSVSIGDACMLGKIEAKDKWSTYCVFGDPSLKMSNLTNGIKFNFRRSNGSTTDTLNALTQYTISGAIVKSDGEVDTSFNSNNGDSVYMSIANPSEVTTRKDGEPISTKGDGTPDFTYTLPGAPVAAKTMIISKGQFSGSFLVPIRLTCDKPGVIANCFAWKKSKMLHAGGAKSDLILSCKGQDHEKLTDTSGPVITVSPQYTSGKMTVNNASFTDELTLSLPATISINLSDETGIDAISTEPDEGITVEIKGRVARENVNNLFQYTNSECTRGAVSYLLNNQLLQPGEYDLVVCCSDVIGNKSSRLFKLKIVKEQQLDLSHVFNFPNPMKMGQTTQFFFSPSTTTFDYSFIIRIYSLSGKLLCVLNNAGNGQRWGGRDQLGNVLSPNIYLYQIRAYYSNESSTDKNKSVKSDIKKLVIHPF